MKTTFWVTVILQHDDGTPYRVSSTEPSLTFSTALEVVGIYERNFKVIVALIDRVDEGPNIITQTSPIWHKCYLETI